MSRLVIASAARFESSDLVANLAEKKLHSTQLIVGVGMTESAIVASRLRDFVADRDVIFCCTGGTLGKFNGVQIFRAACVGFRPPDVRSGKGYLVAGAEPELSPISLPVAIPECIIAGSGSISIVPEANTNGLPTLETLEAYSVARTWAQLARSLTIIVASTNAVGPNAHQEWKENFLLAAKMTTDILVPEIVKLKDRWS